MGKTEGNGCVNDFTREYASVAWCQWLAQAWRSRRSRPMHAWRW
jgi:hypothetical protein